MDQGVKKPTVPKHWGNTVGCVMDTETTGLVPGFHEIYQVAIIPFDKHFNRIKEIPPFIIYMRPQFPERIDPKALSMNKESTKMSNGVDQMTGADLLEDWYNSRFTVYTSERGMKPKIMPLGHNYQFDKAFISAWLGAEIYESMFDYHYRDSMNTAAYLNDYASFHGEELPHPKVSLVSLANDLHINNEGAHDAGIDALMTLNVYKELVKRGPVVTIK